uniref:DNA-directed RNA polymerase subunit n=1 Tax=Eutreptiella sp. CCMP389 TaxID=96781 RepID=A0A977PIL6_9EUGL|nr:RNA polymerase beta' subunit [Eutreptiella sp. CCMP389]
MDKNFEYIQIRVASPSRIRSWSTRTLPSGRVLGEVLSSDTLNYKTLRPEINGLFCERIFGPIKNWECACGRYKRQKIRKNLVFCSSCQVEVTESKIRRYRLGFLELVLPIVHILYLKYISILLDIKLVDIKKIIYFKSFLSLQDNFLDDLELNSFFGAEALHKILKEINLGIIAFQLGESAFYLNSGLSLKNFQVKKNKVIRRLRLINHLLKMKIKPEWMIISSLPILPPDLRPIILLENDYFASSDLNVLYKRIINCNNRLSYLKKCLVTEILVNNERRFLQESIDSLFLSNKQSVKSNSDMFNTSRSLKSLSSIVSGKQGRFRQNLLGKRVDYSGRTVIVVEPELKLFECGLPKEVALELFKPLVIFKLISLRLSRSVRSAKLKILQKEIKLWKILKIVVKNHPILLNRAPTLHRLGIQAFLPKLNDFKTVQLHPLVCSAFNADFDGDQMAIHVPLSIESQAEARLLMLASNNWLSPANGSPIMTLTQDMVLGIYFLTLENLSLFNLFNKFFYFNNKFDVFLALERDKISMQTFIWLKLQNHFFSEIESYQSFIKLNVQEKILIKKIDLKESFDFIRTTPGRIVFDQAIREFL